MVAKKRASKRQTLSQKYKIKKRVVEHHKRLKKGVLTGKGGKAKKVQDSIPNAWPFKEDLLKEIQVAKDRMEEVRLQQKERRRELQIKRRFGEEDPNMMTEETEVRSKNILSKPLSVEESSEYNDNEDLSGTYTKTSHLGQNSRRSYLRELRKVVDSADVVLQVLDARDPLGTRSVAIEEMVLGTYGKKIVYVLNKADLVPREILIEWLIHLRKMHPTVPFKCNTQQGQKGNLGQTKGKMAKQQESALQTNSAIGADELLSLLKNYARIGDTKSTICVGVVGFPNVGKSSLINSLMRTRSVGVSSMPGFTKVHQEVILDKNIRLMDCPGIVFADGDSTATALRNCANVEEMEDVITPIQAILERCPQAYLMQLYAISKFKALDAMGFLALIARSGGKLKKGGIPNTDAAARTVLHDWNTGRIKFYCKAPKAENGGGAGESDSMILSSFSSEVDVDNLKDEDIRVLDGLYDTVAAENQLAIVNGAQAQNLDDFIGIGDIGSDLILDISSGSKMSSINNNMEMDDDRSDAGSIKSTRSKKVTKSTRVIIQAEDEEQIIDKRKAQKDKKKKNSKTERRIASSGVNMDEDYDFNTDFN
jgi:nuclear GTP-binding protein